MLVPALVLTAAFAAETPATASAPTEAPSSAKAVAASASPALVMGAQTVASPAVAAEIPAAIPTAISEAQAARLRAYKHQRLRVIDETELLGGAASVAMTQPTPGPGRSSSVVVVDPFYTIHTWGVYAGDRRLSPTEFFRETGESFRADDLDRRIERNRRKARRWMVVAGVGAASLAAGVVQYDRATDLPQQVLAQQLTFGGLGVGMTGLMAASFPATRAARVEHYPSAVLEREDAEAMAERHNRALQETLGLTEADRLLLELADSL